MTGTDHPPSTTSPTRVARRALSTSLAAIVAIAAPVALVATTAGGPSLASASEPYDLYEATTTSFLDQLDAVREVRAQSDSGATLADVETVATAVAPTTVAPPTTTAPAPTTTAPPPPPPAAQPVASSSGYSDPNNPAAWDRLAQCESGGNWAANTGNGYYGGIQFSLSSWQAVGGTGRPDQASRETQIAMGQRLWNQGGWQHWPGCSRELGYL
jgi:hypothetical protein